MVELLFSYCGALVYSSTVVERSRIIYPFFSMDAA
jgi:hypothetical protein